MSKESLKTQLSLLNEQQTEIRKHSSQNSQALLKQAQQKIFDDAMKVLAPVMRFGEIGFDSDGNVDENTTPEDWDTLPRAEKEKMLRLAKTGWMPSADVPHGVKMAHATVMGIIKATAQENSGNKTLHIENVQFPAPAPLTKTVNPTDVIDVED